MRHMRNAAFGVELATESAGRLARSARNSNLFNSVIFTFKNDAF